MQAADKPPMEWNSEVIAANPQLVVDLSSNTGRIKYGASGFLYGLGNDSIPSVNMLAPLRPQVAAQKPEGGLQHPNGDALNVAHTYKVAGGKEVEIYIQDVYPDWPYDNLGIHDYLTKVDSVTRQVVASPNRSMFSYVPFNEPDQIWYNKSDKKQAFFNDWKTVGQKIKSIDPAARIVGPNFSRYDSSFYRDFLTFARDSRCLPDVISWHELNDDFFPGWYSRYDDYRSIESSLGMSAREICINEYGRSSGDLGIPGKLVQWIARFENSKVDACLAYWTTAGCLDDLVTRDHYNQATGGWWLYRWYGGMTGNTVKVTPPNANAEGLQGLASLDNEKKQARILFGGSSGSADVVVKGFGSTPYFGSKVHVIVWATASTGILPSSGPTFVMEGDYAIANGQIALTVNNMVDTTAYQMMITPDTNLSSANDANRYEAEYADILGSAKITYSGNTGYSGTGFVESCGGSNNASTTFVVTASHNGFYNVRLRYSAGPIGNGNTPPTRTIGLMLNGSPLKDVSVPATADWNTWADANISVFLTAGINRIALDSFTNDDRSAMNIDYIEVTSASGAINAYEAEAAGNTLGGTAAVMNDSAASGGKYVGDIGNGVANTLQFNNVQVPSSGTFRMVVYFANAENRGSHDYNAQVVDRYADISVNGSTAKRVYFRNTFAWNVYQTTVIDVNLNAGNNTIKFANSLAYAPHIDKIEIASRFQLV
jgi:hypothetical protein